MIILRILILAFYYYYYYEFFFLIKNITITIYVIYFINCLTNFSKIALYNLCNQYLTTYCYKRRLPCAVLLSDL